MNQPPTHPPTHSIQVEAALGQHPSVAESAVVGVPHDIKGRSTHSPTQPTHLSTHTATHLPPPGNCLYCYVTLKAGQEPSEETIKQLKVLVRNQLGAFAAPDFIQWAPQLPKTRSGKVRKKRRIDPTHAPTRPPTHLPIQPPN